MNDTMVTTGTLDKIFQSKMSGDLFVTIRISKEMANEAHRRLGGYIDPAKSRWVALAIMDDKALEEAHAGA